MNISRDFRPFDKLEPPFRERQAAGKKSDFLGSVPLRVTILYIGSHGEYILSGSDVNAAIYET